MQLLQRDNTTARTVLNITLTNSDIPEHLNGTTTSGTESHMTTDDWRFPFVAYSPAGIVEVRKINLDLCLSLWWVRKINLGLCLSLS